MLMKTEFILIIVVWLVVAGLIIRNKFILFKQLIPTIATNATLGDIVNAINNLQTNLQNTIYAAVWVGVCAIIAVMILFYYAK